MSTKALTSEDIRRFAASRYVHQAQAMLILARAKAIVTREQVDAYIAPVFARYTFTDKRTGERITTPRDLYRADQEADCADFYADCDDAHRAHGYHLKPGYCPALVAEDQRRKAEQALLIAASEAIGMDFTEVYGDLRKQALELFDKMPRDAAEASP